MVEKFGVSVDDELAARIEELRVRESEFGDHEVVSRSAVVAELVSLGLAAHDVLEGVEGLERNESHARRAFVRQALLDALADEGLEGDDRGSSRRRE